VQRGANGGRRRLTVISRAWLACACLLLSGCGLLSKPEPLSADAPLTMSVTSSALRGSLLPAQFTCHKSHGRPENPPIFWSGAPTATKSIAVVIDDADAPIAPRIYWLVFDIGSSTTDLQTGMLPPHALVAYNTAGHRRYDAPCPENSIHKYRITVYALNTFFSGSLASNPQLLPTWTAIARHVIARGTITVRALP
jgi:Raf kinase inhibitor-like YbhB/YbcL family protein